MNEAGRIMVDHFMSNLHETEELYSAMRKRHIILFPNNCQEEKEVCG